LGALKDVSRFPVIFGHAWTGQDILKVFLDICGHVLTWTDTPGLFLEICGHVVNFNPSGVRL